MPIKDKNYLLLHLIVFIWGWTAILGRTITLDALQLVWYRMPIALLGILAYMAYKRQKISVSLPNLFKILGVGIIVAIHWVCFYAAIKESNVSVALTSFSCGTLFTALLEPLLYKRKVIWYELVFGLLAMLALYLIFNVEVKYKLGILYGVVAAFTASLFGVLNGLMVKRGFSASNISLFQLLGGSIGLTVFAVTTGAFNMSWLSVSSSDWAWLIVLSLVCTSFPYIITMNILKTISPYTITLTLNLETIYGIILAFLIFNEHEHMSTTFFIGTIIILSTIFVNAWLKRYLKPVVNDRDK